VRVVVAASVLAAAADAVLVAQHLLKLGVNLVTSLARLHEKNLARRSSLEAGSTREKKGGKERRSVRNSAWQFSTENRKCRLNARVFPERENEVRRAARQRPGHHDQVPATHKERRRGQRHGYRD
jgi:uncharacterized protein (DUF1778 family)